jgi:arylsulfatase A-like enzyme
MITRLDQYVGQIFAKLREKGLDDNTIVIFTSDNGPHEEGGADPEFFGRMASCAASSDNVMREASAFRLL